MSREPIGALIARSVYAVRHGVRLRGRLKALLRAAPTNQRPWDLSPEQFMADGATILVLDFDGVLAPYGAARPTAEMEAWIDRSIRVFGAEHIFMLSNKPMAARIEFFEQRYPGIRWITGFRPKPYPDGMARVIAESGAPPEQVILVDDRLLTGALSATIAGASVCYVRRPVVALSGRTVSELFFMTLRGLERALLRLV